MRHWMMMVMAGLTLAHPVAGQGRDTVRLRELTVTATRDPVAREVTTT